MILLLCTNIFISTVLIGMMKSQFWYIFNKSRFTVLRSLGSHSGNVVNISQRATEIQLTNFIFG